MDVKQDGGCVLDWNPVPQVVQPVAEPLSIQDPSVCDSFVLITTMYIPKEQHGMLGCSDYQLRVLLRGSHVSILNTHYSV